MLNWNRIEKLNIPLPATVREMLTPNTVVSIVAAESLFSQTPTHTTYEWCGGMSSQSSGCVCAAVLGRGHWIALDIAEDWSNAQGESSTQDAPPIGEQLEMLGVLRPAILVLLSEDEGGRSTLTIGIGGRSIRRYLEWRVRSAAAELTDTLRAAVPEPPKEPIRKRSRAHLLAD